MRASPVLRLVRPEISRFPCKERARMPGSSTTPGRPSACVDALGHVAFRYTDSVGTREQFSIAAQWLACTYPYRRFAAILTNASARLGADVVRYSFIAVDLHHLLLAGLPAHSTFTFRYDGRRTALETICGGKPAAAVAKRRGDTLVQAFVDDIGTVLAFPVATRLRDLALRPALLPGH